MSDIYLQITETPTVVTLSAPVISGALSSTVTVANTVTVALDANSLSALENVTVTVGAAIIGTVTVSNFPASQAVTFSAVTISNFPSTQPVSLATVPTHGVTLTSTTVTVSSLPALPAGTAQIGSVTASISGTVPVSGTFWQATQPVSGTFFQATQPVSLTSTTVTVSSMPAVSGSVTLGASTAQIGSVTASISGTVPVSGTFFQGTQPVSLTTLPALVAGTAQIGVVTIGNIRRAGDNALSQLSTEAGSNYLLTVVMPGTSQIGSVTASISNSVTIASLPAISGTVTANLAISSTVITSGSFTSLTSATIVPGNTARKMATVYNLGAGQLFINTGATATTLGGGFMVALFSGDYFECDYTTTTLSAIFATAGTASWISH